MDLGQSSLSQELGQIRATKRCSKEFKIAAVRALRYFTTSQVCTQYKVSARTLYRWKKIWEESGSLAQRPIPGRPRILGAEETERLCKLYVSVATISNAEVASIIKKIRPRTVSDYAKRAGLTRKLISDECETYSTEESLQQVRQYLQEIRSIPLDKRVYMDESFIYDNEAPKRGRSPRGMIIPRVRSRHGKRWTVYLAIRADGFVHPPLISDECADDRNFYHYVWEHLTPNLRPGEIVIWDRLGRAGRCKTPTKQHYNPDAIRLIERAKCQVKFLPPKGKFFNPIELVFGCIKTHLRNNRHNTTAFTEQRPYTEEELKIELLNAAMKINADCLSGFYRERSGSRAFRRHYPNLCLNLEYEEDSEREMA